MFARYFYLVMAGFCAAAVVFNHMGHNSMAFAAAMVGLIASGWGFVRSPGPVNVWDMQHNMMRASGQPLPDVPTVTKTSVLYVALMLEELSETLTAQLRVLATNTISRLSNASLLGLQEQIDQRDKQVSLVRALQVHATAMSNMSQTIREHLASQDDFAFVATLEQANDLVDGASDVMVIAAGINESLGLPGDDAYFIVQSSNLSKCNPETGMIDKTPDGKWIKGCNYQPPTPRIRAMLQGMMVSE